MALRRPWNTEGVPASNTADLDVVSIGVRLREPWHDTATTTPAALTSMASPVLPRSGSTGRPALYALPAYGRATVVSPVRIRARPRCRLCFEGDHALRGGDSARGTVCRRSPTRRVTLVPPRSFKSSATTSRPFSSRAAGRGPSIGIRDVIQDVVDECLAVAAAEATSTPRTSFAANRRHR